LNLKKRRFNLKNTLTKRSKGRALCWLVDLFLGAREKAILKLEEVNKKIKKTMKGLETTEQTLLLSLDNSKRIKFNHILNNASNLQDSH
jgi:hypothetical protein